MDKKEIKKAMSAIAAVDADVAVAVGEVGLPEPRLRPAGFETFLSTIISQQISTEAATTIKGRVVALMSDISASAMLQVVDEDLRGAGMSYRKIEYAKGMAEAIVEKRFDPEALSAMDDEAVIEAITDLRGFGRWSAEIYLMFSLRRPDIFPADDLALQVALGRLKGLDKKPTPKLARELCAHWAPWRSVGSLFLWRYYRGAPT